MSAAPAISVIIATYNWSSALSVALESARAQTLQNFEILVVGDGCTDDSEGVVASFADERITFTNLDRNYGSQWAANNRGLELARAPYVAYLGHDDLWWPTHLANAVRHLEAGADVVAGLALFYGPPESGVHALSGGFPNGQYNAHLFVPPSSLAHRTDLVRRIGPWRSMKEARYSVDNDFMIRASEAGARIQSTGEVTTFKFSAGWRRGSYLKRDAAEQRRNLDLMREQGEAYRTAQLTAALEAAALNRFIQLEVPLNESHDALPNARRRWAFKGTQRANTSLDPVRATMRVYPNDESSSFEWHGWEEGPHGRYRWSGPSTISTLSLPVAVGGKIRISLLVVAEIASGLLESARLTANGMDIAMTVIAREDGTFLWEGSLDGRVPFSLDGLQLTIHVARTWRPFDRGRSEDRRWLGLAVGWTELAPAT